MPRTPAETTRPIRIAYVIQNLNFGGMERVLHGLASELPRRGFEIHLVVLEFYGHFAEGLEDRVTMHQVPAMSRFSLLHPRALAQTLRGIDPQIVHTHAGVWLKGTRAARLAGIGATVHTEHGRPDPVPLSDRIIDNIASRQTDVILAVSEPLAEVLRNQVVHEPSRVRVIANGVDTRRILASSDSTALRRALGLPVDSTVIGSIGRLEPIKNYRLALRALARMGLSSRGHAAPILVLVGDGSQRDELETLARELGLESRVRFLGWRTDAERLYGAFDLFTLTSRSEGTSISMLEAMSAGICPVVTDVGGNRTVLGSDLDSLLVPDDDDAALAAAWQALLDDPGRRHTMGARARARVQNAFSLDRMIDEHAALYKELMQRQGLRGHEPQRDAPGVSRGSSAHSR
jgi:glycosyltransferase involved in cell wall biosynthesis